MKFLKKIWITALFMALVGCKSIGPHQITIDRYRYNDVLLNTKKEELLANIVRTRYLEPLSFMKITNITASYSLSPSVGSSNTATLEGRTPSIYKLGFAPEIKYSDQPTISYEPVSTSEFIREIYSPIALDSLHTLMFGGALDPRLMLKLAFQYIVNLDFDNASELSNSEILFIPRYQEFHIMLKILGQLQKLHGVRVIAGTIEQEPTIGIAFNPGYTYHPLAIKLKKHLKIPLDDSVILFSQKPYKETNILHIETRSIKGLFNYLSHGVILPPEDAKIQGGDNISSNGKRVDVSAFLRGIFRVYYSKTEPFDVYVKAYVHRHWFYIKESDRNSKLTFNFLNSLILLTAKQLGKEENTGPVLTIPAAR